MIQLQRVPCLPFWSQRSVPFGERLSASWVVNFKGVQSTLENPFSSALSSVQRQHFKVEKNMRFMRTVQKYLAKQNELADASGV